MATVKVQSAADKDDSCVCFSLDESKTVFYVETEDGKTPLDVVEVVDALSELLFVEEVKETEVTEPTIKAPSGWFGRDDR